MPSTIQSIAVKTQLGQWVVHTLSNPTSTGAHPDNNDWVICWPTVMSDHRSYLEFAHRIRPHFRVLLIDPPGYYANRDMSQTERVSGMMLMLLRALHELKIDQFHWVGVGFGAHLGAALQRKCAERFLSATFSSMPLIQAARVSWSSKLAQNLLVRSAWGRKIFADHICSQMSGVSPSEFESVKLHVERVIEDCNVQVLKNLAPTAQQQLNALRVILKTSQVPTLVVAGKHDNFCKLRDQQTLAQLIRRSKFAPLDCGFLTFFVLPEECARIFIEFVDKFAEKPREPKPIANDADPLPDTSLRSVIRALDQSDPRAVNSTY